MSTRAYKSSMSVILLIITVFTLYGCGSTRNIALGDEISVGSVTRRYDVPTEETVRMTEEATASSETTAATSAETTAPVETTRKVTQEEVTAAPATQKVDPVTEAPADNVPTTVYWTENGEVWHRSRSCPSLTRSKYILSGTTEQSGKTRGCQRCS